MKWLKKKPNVDQTDLIIMNFEKKKKIHKNIRLRRTGFYIFKVKDEYCVIGKVVKPCVLNDIESWAPETEMTIKRNIKELHALVVDYFKSDNHLNSVEKRIVQKLLKLAKIKAYEKTTEKSTWFRMCCLWDKIRQSHENDANNIVPI
tara:strand:- start:2901 stop:3341 length:441 start_codon:yes stop_codon:yes gene_type:complete